MRNGNGIENLCLQEQRLSIRCINRLTSSSSAVVRPDVVNVMCVWRQKPTSEKRTRPPRLYTALLKMTHLCLALLCCGGFDCAAVGVAASPAGGGASGDLRRRVIVGSASSGDGAESNRMVLGRFGGGGMISFYLTFCMVYCVHLRPHRSQEALKHSMHLLEARNFVTMHK